MSPEEKEMLMRSLKLAEENNRLLTKVEHTIRMQVIWGFLRAMIIIVPLVAGYFFLQSKASNLDLGTLLTSF